MKQLLLLRHAESESAPPGSKDFERPLTERGRWEALDAATVIAAGHPGIDIMLVSPARRTRETAQLVADRVGLGPRQELVPQLYLATPEEMLRVLVSRAGSSDVVLLVGHNPGVSELACLLSGDQLPSLRTSGLCRLTWPLLRWDELGAVHASAAAILR